MSRAVRVLAVNFIPPLGVAIFGWSTLVALLLIYVDAFALVAAVSLVLAVAIAEEEPSPRRGPFGRLGYVAAVWGAGVALLGFFPLIGAVLLFSMMGMPWQQLIADVRSESGLIASTLLLVAAHGRDVMVSLAGDRAASERQALDDFSMMLLRAFAFPVAGGLVLLAVAPFGRAGQLAVLVLLAVTMTAGELYRDRWLRLVAPGVRCAPISTDGDPRARRPVGSR